MLATEGPYARIRHPQYTGYILIMAGFLMQWPTLPTLVMFPVLLYFYRRLAMHEEQEVRERFGAAWDRYAAGLPRFVPRRGRRASPPPSAGRPASALEGSGVMAAEPAALAAAPELAQAASDQARAVPSATRDVKSATASISSGTREGSDAKSTGSTSSKATRSGHALDLGEVDPR